MTYYCPKLPDSPSFEKLAEYIRINNQHNDNDNNDNNDKSIFNEILLPNQK
jgi:hypothetical protein